MKRLLRYILTVVFMGYLLFALVWGVRSARRQECKGLCVTVVDSMRAQYISTAEILRLLKGHAEWEEHIPLAKINTDELETLLYKNSLIKEAKCYTTPSGLLRIDVSQRRPIMRIIG
ncbi:MAG: hypothetical protein LUC18_02580, partial [Porphyromonadaceae bacterium]|nr:hypothetical protein [Porphyromonadaceae bacterium]